jgi:hypothetical protein
MKNVIKSICIGILIYLAIICVAWLAFQRYANPVDGFYTDSFYMHPVSLVLLFICKALLLPSIWICHFHHNKLVLNWELLVLVPILQSILLHYVLKLRKKFWFWLVMLVYISFIVYICDSWYSNPSWTL